MRQPEAAKNAFRLFFCDGSLRQIPVPAGWLAADIKLAGFFNCPAVRGGLREAKNFRGKLWKYHTEYG